MRRRRWFYGLVSALGLAVGTTAVVAQPAPPGELTISPTSGPPGTKITVEGTGCPPTAGITAFLFDEGAQRNLDLEAANPGADGAWTTTLVVPTGYQPAGRVLVGATCAPESEYRAQVFRVTVPMAGQPGSPSVALTG